MCSMNIGRIETTINEPDEGASDPDNYLDDYDIRLQSLGVSL